MKSQTSIKKNFIYQMIYQILIIILPFVTSPYIARTIGAEGLGTYSYSYSIAYYLCFFHAWPCKLWESGSCTMQR